MVGFAVMRFQEKNGRLPFGKAKADASGDSHESDSHSEAAVVETSVLAHKEG